MHFRADLAPDYLLATAGSYFNRGGFCFTITASTIEDLLGKHNCKLEIEYETRNTPIWLTNLLGVDILRNVMVIRSSVLNDDDLEYLEGMNRLHELDLTGADITDVGLKRLQNLNNLEILSLAHTKISKTGLKYLRQLKTLKTVYIYCIPGITFSAIQAVICDELPHLDMRRGPETYSDYKTQHLQDLTPPNLINLGQEDNPTT
jgi:hypothetical protein